MLTAREELDIGEKTVAAEIDAYFRLEIISLIDGLTSV